MPVTLPRTVRLAPASLRHSTFLKLGVIGVRPLPCRLPLGPGTANQAKLRVLYRGRRVPSIRGPAVMRQRLPGSGCPVICDVTRILPRRHGPCGRGATMGKKGGAAIAPLFPHRRPTETSSAAARNGLRVTWESRVETVPKPTRRLEPAGKRLPAPRSESPGVSGPASPLAGVSPSTLHPRLP